MEFSIKKNLCVWGVAMFDGLASFLAPPAGSLVGFAGSRALSPADPASAVLASVLAGLAALPAIPFGVGVGCAPGADALVRSACSSLPLALRVFSAAALPFSALPPRAALAARSAALVRAVAAARGGWFFVAPGRPCPAAAGAPAPRRSWASCASGSWSVLSLAAGLGCRVFLVGPAALLPGWPAGAWLPARAASGVSAPGLLWAWAPAAVPVAARLPGF